MRLLDVAVAEGVFIAAQLVTGIVRERRVLGLERDLEQREGFAPNSWDMRCIGCGKRMRSAARGVYSMSFEVGDRTITQYSPFHLRKRCQDVAVRWWNENREASSPEDQ